MACVTLYIFADGVIRDIAFTLGVGIVIGTYSSIYIASPLLIMTDRWEKKRAEASLKTARA
jgi:preprotein translocase subunit SecF